MLSFVPLTPATAALVYMVWFGGRIHVGGAKYEESAAGDHVPGVHGGEVMAVFRAKTDLDAEEVF